MRTAARGVLVAAIGLFAVGTWAAGDVGIIGARVGATEGVARGSPGGRVLIISTPRLTWQTLERAQPRHLLRLLDRAAVASMSVRTARPLTTPGAAYLTLGAGNRAGTDPLFDGVALDVDSSYQGTSAAAAYQRATGIEPDSPIVVPGIARLERVNTELFRYGTEIGSLGHALGEAGTSAAVIANADEGLDAPYDRHAGLAVMDRNGQIHVGTVDDSLLVVDQLAPFGVRLDPGRVLSAFETAWGRSSVVLVELSDLERADAVRPFTTPEFAQGQYEAMLRDGDDLIGEMLQRVDLRRDTVLVVAPTAPAEETQLTVFGIAGQRFAPGWAQSSSTRRAGYVTLPDVAPTVLSLLGIDVPRAMNDTRITSVGGEGGTRERISAMVEDNDRALVRDRTFGTITTLFIVALILELAMGVVALARYRQLRRPATVGGLLVLAVPTLAFLSGLLPLGSFSLPQLIVVIFGGGLLVGLVGSFAARERPERAAIALLAAMWLVLALDVLTGGHLQINTTFGYSPIVAGRFSGFGNQAFSLFSIAAVILVAAAWSGVPPATSRRRFLVAAGAFLGVSVLINGLPAFGADVGGVLALVPTAIVALLLISGRRIRVWYASVIGLVTLVVLGAFAALDLRRPPEARTHLGRFVSSLLDGDAGLIFQRKLEANLSVLRSTALTWVIPIALIYLAYLAWRPNSVVRAVQAEHRGFRVLGIAGLVLAVLATLLNDSGVSMPAMMLAVALSYTNIVALHTAALNPGGSA